MSTAASGAGYFLIISWLSNDPDQKALTSLFMGLFITGANQVTWQRRSQGAFGWTCNVLGLGILNLWAGRGAALHLVLWTRPARFLGHDFFSSRGRLGFHNPTLFCPTLPDGHRRFYVKDWKRVC